MNFTSTPATYQDAIRAAQELLYHTGLDPEDSARLILELLEGTGEMHLRDKLTTILHCRDIIHKGTTTYLRKQQTLPFKQVVDDFIRHKFHRSPSTLTEIRQCCNRIMTYCPDWQTIPLREITTEDCQRAIDASFCSNNMQRKGINILRALFTFGITRGLCEGNPLQLIEKPEVIVRPIKILSLKQIQKMLKCALESTHRPCAPALGLLIWTGIRPSELEQLCWEKIDLNKRRITLDFEHIKTPRQLTIPPVLSQWFRRCCVFTPSKSKLIPRAWAPRWRHLRLDAGITHWRTETLRHTFAAYHLKHFKDPEALRKELGLRSVEELHTRFLCDNHLSTETAGLYWGLKASPISRYRHN